MSPISLAARSFFGVREIGSLRWATAFGTVSLTNFIRNDNAICSVDG